ncbi:unnamed protein product [Auanema sp. JU1783]|nr:unnamed protein product [Auanema sp. JU1783]
MLAGSLYDTSRRGGNSGRSNNGRTGGANSLLKQAIANRLKPNSEFTGPGGKPEGNEGLEDSMTKSIVMNPAWYRDDEGRTGFKTREWEDVPNLQKNQVKARRKHKSDETAATAEPMEAIDQDLWKNNEEEESKVDASNEGKESRKKRHRSKDSSQQLQEAMESLEKVVEPQESSEEKKKLTKEEKKALKDKEKEEKKERDEREKEVKRQAKEEKKKEKEREKEEKKLQKLEKKNKSQTSLNKVDDDLESQKKKSKPSSSSTKDDISEKHRDEKPRGEREPKKSRSRRSESTEKQSSEARPEKHKSDETKTLPPTERKTKSSDVEDKRKSKSSSKSEITSSKMKSPVTRQDSNDSVASSVKSTITVREASASILSPKTHRKPPSGRTTLSSPQTSTSSPEDEKTTSGRTVSRDRRPRKETIGERRDSSVSESSRISAVSHKSVTFCDHIQTHEIERLEFSSSEDDVAVMSDDEMSRSDVNKRRTFSHLLQKRQNEEINRPQSLQMYNEDDDFEEQERRVEQMIEMGQIPQGYPIYNVGNVSENGFYTEDEHEDEEGSYISLDRLPATVRKAIVAEMQQRDLRGFDCAPMGSMTRLHDPGSSPSLLSYPPSLPRSASGYLEQDEEMMSRSYQNAMYGTAFHHSSPDSQTEPPEEKPMPDTSEFDRQRRLQESFYDNVHNIPSRTNSLLMPNQQSEVLSDRRNSDTTTIHTNPLSQAIEKRSNISIDRAQFFDSTPAREAAETSQLLQTPTPSPPRLVGAPPPQRLLLTSTVTTTSTKTNRTQIVEKTEKAKQNEDAMKRQFLAKFGSRKAPIAEEDPTDPVHPMGSQESVLSTDSRESVVSAASIKTETTVRRNFNY